MTLKPYLLALLLICGASAARADDASIEGQSGSPRLMTANASIRMVREDVAIDIAAARVRARFVFRNDGPAATVTMGFPETDDTGWQPKTTRMRGFRSTVDGKPVRVRRVAASGADAAHYNLWWTKRVRFAAGQTRVVVDEYTGGRGGTAWRGEWYQYVLKTGASWKGTIGRAVITCDIGGLPYSPIAFQPAGYVRRGSKVVWDLRDIEPKQDIIVSWHDSYTNVLVNGESMFEESDRGQTVPHDTPPVATYEWPNAKWGAVPSERRGDDIWLSAKTAAAWLGAGVVASPGGRTAKLTRGTHWAVASSGSAVLRTDSGPIRMPFASRSVHPPLYQKGGRQITLSLRAVTRAFGGTYRYDASKDQVTVMLP